MDVSLLTVLIVGSGLVGQPSPADADRPSRALPGDAARGGAGSRPGPAPRVVVTGVDLADSGPGTALDREGMQTAIERGLAAGGLFVIPHRLASEALDRHPELRSCAGAPCRAGLARLLGASLCTEVTFRTREGRLEITVSLLDCPSGASRVRLARSCRGGSSEQAAEAVARLVEEASARVVAMAPDHSARPGRRRGAEEPGRPRRDRRVLLWSGISLAAAGLLTATAGATLWGLDGRVYERRPTLDRVYRTRAGGITATSLGLAGMVGGIAMAVLTLRRTEARDAARDAPAAPPRLTVTWDPARRTVGVSGTF